MDSDESEVDSTTLRATRVIELEELENQVSTIESQLRQARIGVPGLAVVCAITILESGFGPGRGGVVSLYALVTALATCAGWAVFEYRARGRMRSLDAQIAELDTTREFQELPGGGA